MGFDRELFPPSVPPPEKPPDDDAVERAVAIFNAMAVDTGWPKVGKITAQRRSAIRARLRECDGIDGWRQALERAARSTFLRGDNDRGWRAGLDFFLQAKSFTKLIEGAYDDKRSTAPAASRGTPAITDDQWETFVARHRQDTSQWPYGVLGPSPEETGCRAPVEVLVQHGFRRADAA